MTKHIAKPMLGMFLVVDRKSDEGLSRWTRELVRRKIPALVLADGHTVTQNPQFIKSIADEGFDIGCGYNDGALWEETHEDVIAWLPRWLDIDQPYMKSPYEIQKCIIEYLNDRISPLIGKTMPVFSGKYFSYDENTLKIADEMGIQYILARGTEKERAVFYQPKEFKATLISVSNVPSKQLGTGSLCDESLEARKETPEDFRRILFDIYTDRIVLVAQTHVSGLRQDWWDVYMEFLDSGRLQWQALHEFAANPTVMPNKDIPVNKRAEYMKINLEKAKIAGEMV
jgi:hypothetical protein